MNELEPMIENVKKALAIKKEEVANRGESVTAQLKDELKQRQVEVDAFEHNIFMINADSTADQVIIEQYESDAQELIVRINRIVVI